MTSHEADCTDAVLAFGVQVFNELATGQRKALRLDDEAWRRGDDGITRLQVMSRLFVPLDLLGQSTQTEPVRKAIQNDAQFGPMIGALVGSQTGSTRFDESTVINAVVQSMVDMDGSTEERIEAARSQILNLRVYLAADQRESLVLIPLPGIKASTLPFQIEDGLEIDTFSESEVDCCAKTGILQPLFPGVRLLTAEECVGVRIRVSVPAVVTRPGEQPLPIPPAEITATHRFGERMPWRFHELAEDLLFVLRLARAGAVTARGSVLLTDGPLGTSRSWGTRSVPHLARTAYELDEDTGRNVRELWSLMKQPGSRSLPAICARRFNAALDRGALDDAVVDQLIAAEALFLNDVGSPKERGELGYRLSLRAGHLLEKAGRSRRETFKFMKRAYDLRSSIAHGGMAPAHVSVPGRDRIPLGLFVGELAEMMRTALALAIHEFRDEPKFATSQYWDRLILDRTPHDPR